MAIFRPKNFTFDLDDFKKPSPAFDLTSTKDLDVWHDIIFRMACINIPAVIIADYLLCNRMKFKANPAVMDLIKEGHAIHRLIIDGELQATAELKISDFDKDERAAMSNLKFKAVSLLKACIQKKEEFISPDDLEKVRRLSDEELDKRIRAAAKERE